MEFCSNIKSGKDKIHYLCTIMADKMTPEQRHKCMAAIRSKNTKPELMVRNFLFANGLRFRINDRRLPGSPDIVLPRFKTVVFIDGCFWHGHENCKLYRLPSTNTEFWQAKIERNRARDIDNNAALTTHGWQVIRLWTCDLQPRRRHITLYRLLNLILANSADAAPYSTPEFPDISIAAEPQTPYGQDDLQ